MGILIFLFVAITLVLLVIHGLSAIQLYKQKNLGPQAVPSIMILSILWGVGFLSAVINLFAYIASKP